MQTVKKVSWWERFLLWVWENTVDDEELEPLPCANESGFTPNGDLVLIKPNPVEKKTASGIVLVDTTTEKEARAARVGVVLDAGDDAWRQPRMKGVKRDMQVYFGRYAGDFLPIDGVDYIVMRAENILGPIDRIPDFAFNPAKAPMDAFAA